MDKQLKGLFWYDDFDKYFLGHQLINLGNSGYTLIDAEDFDRVTQHKWSLSGKRAMRKKLTGERWVTEYLHRFIMNCPSEMEVDHINMNQLDNRKTNLRICSHKENMFNLGLRSTNRSGFKGVRFKQDHHKWQAFLKKDYKQVFLGYFDTKEEAARAYDKAATDLFGQYARTNF